MIDGAPADTSDKSGVEDHQHGDDPHEAGRGAPRLRSQGDPVEGSSHWLSWSRLKTAPQLTPRLYLVMVSLALLGMALAQQPGKTVIDTKPALALNPSGYLGQQLHLWNAAAEGGSIPNQTVGYLAPMGPFFLLTHALGIPTSVAQRLWLALLLVVAFWGVVRLCDALGIGNRLGRVLGGLAYALSPWALSRVGDLSAFVIGGVMLPWILLPLVHFTHGPRPPEQRTSARRTAARSGFAVFLIGGTNASVALCVLIAPALWLLLMCRGRAAWTLRAWWVAAVGAATLWWGIALVIQGRYGIDFLSYTETAKVTTSVTSLAETIRGTPDWYDYLRFSVGGGTASGWTYITTPAAIAGSIAIAGFGLAGLGRTRIPVRRFWLACLGLGVVAVAAAYPEGPNGVLSTAIRHLLSGALGPLRNVTKFEPLIRLPLAIGVASCLPVFSKSVLAKRRAWPRALTAGIALVLTGTVVLAAAPLGLIRIYQDDNFSVPSYWKTAAAWLAKSATDSRTLLLPGSAFAEYSWGNPRDEPLLWLGKTDWAVRDLIPFGSINSTRLLDGIEQQLEQRSAPNLASTLTRSGMGYVLVRNDLDVPDDPPASTAQIHAALASSGLKRIASFGPMVASRPSSLESYFHIPVKGPSYPTLEVYKVPGASRVSVYPTADTAVISGGPEALTTLSGSALLGDRPTVLAADVAAGSKGHSQLPASVKPNTWIDTDTLDRRETAYGLVNDAQSYLETAGSRAAIDTTAPQIRFDVDPQGHETVARYVGIKNVTASASGFVLRPVSQQGPPAAVDGDPNTAWSVVGYPNHNVGQWLQVTFAAPRQVPAASVQLRTIGVRIQELRVTTDGGSRITRLQNTAKPQALNVPQGPTSHLRVTIAAATGTDKHLAGAGISELTIAGVKIQRQVVLPNDVGKMFNGGQPQTISYVFARERSDPHAEISVDAEQQLNRVFTVPRATDFSASGTAVMRQGAVNLPSTAGNTVNLGCGSGPDVEIDKQRIKTYVSGSRTALEAGSPIPLGLCLRRPIALAAGQHTLTTSPGSTAIQIATLTLTNQLHPPAPATRKATIGQWGLEHRTVNLSAGASSVLTIHENFSASWTATVNGKKLVPIQVDGWQQGFVVPAGGAITVKITNYPGIAWRIGLLVGAVAVLLLALAALLPGRRRARRPNAIAQPRSHSRRVVQATSFVATVAIAALVAGPLAAALVPVVALVVWLVRGVAPFIVLAAFSIATGLAIGDTKRYPAAHSGVFSPVTQIAIALAIAAVVLAAGAPGAEAAQIQQDPTEPPDNVGHGLGDTPADDAALSEGTTNPPEPAEVGATRL